MEKSDPRRSSSSTPPPPYSSPPFARPNLLSPSPLLAPLAPLPPLFEKPLFEKPFFEPLPPLFASQPPSPSSSQQQPPKSSSHHRSAWEPKSRRVISQKEWTKIRDNDAKSTTRFPRYHHDASLSKLLVQSPCPLREAIVSAFSSAFHEFLAAMPRPARRDYMVSSGKVVMRFNGKYEGSVRIPGLVLERKNPNGFFEPFVVLEVGIETKTYEELLDDVRLWMSCESIEMIIILNVKENTRYGFPENAREKIPTRASISQDDFHLAGAWGPVVYQGFTFVDSISEASLEVWTKSGRRAQWDTLSMSQDTILPVVDDFGLLVNLDVGLPQSYLRTSLKELALARVLKGVNNS